MKIHTHDRRITVNYAIGLDFTMVIQVPDDRDDEDYIEEVLANVLVNNDNGIDWDFEE